MSTLCLPGDILFYSEDSRDIIDVAISDWTQSKLVHVAIAINSLQKIEALGNGIILNPIIYDQVAFTCNYGSNPGPYIVQALNWLNGMLGQPYGWSDIVQAVTYKLVHGLSISIENHYDCSALATEFLKRSGLPIVMNISQPHDITPAKLYTILTGKTE